MAESYLYRMTEAEFIADEIGRALNGDAWHERLGEIILALSDARLAEDAPQSTRSVAMMLHGVAQHAAYHGGQIALLKKAITPYHRRVAL